MVLFPCSPELFDRRLRVMAAGNTVQAQCDVCHAKAASQPGTPAGVPIITAAMTTATGQVYESLLDPSGKGAATAVSPEETAP